MGDEPADDDKTGDSGRMTDRDGGTMEFIKIYTFYL